jgi:transposase
MADRGRPIPGSTLRALQLLRATLSVRAAARAAGVSPTTVQKYTRAPEAEASRDGDTPRSRANG